MDRSQVWAAQWVAPHRAATSVVTNVCTLIFMLPLNIDALNILLCVLANLYHFGDMVNDNSIVAIIPELGKLWR